MLIGSLNRICKDFLKTSTSTRSRYRGGRINEVGRTIEDALVHEMNKQPLTVKKLPKSGYLILKYLKQITLHIWK